MLKIRQSRDRLIFNMEIPIPGKDGLLLRGGPDLSFVLLYDTAWQLCPAGWVCLHSSGLRPPCSLVDPSAQDSSIGPPCRVPVAQKWQEFSEAAILVRVNPLRAKFFWGNIKIYLHFMSFLRIDMTQVLKILKSKTRTYIYYIVNIMAADVLAT